MLKNIRGIFFFFLGIAWYLLVSYICPKFTIFTKMQANEIQEIGKELKVRRMMRTLYKRLLSKRPTLSPDTLYRAFNDPMAYTELLSEIRMEGKRLLDEEIAAVAA